MSNDELKAHFDAAIANQTRHFDERIGKLEKKVQPVVDVYTTATVGASIWKFVLGALAALGTIALAIIGLWAWVNGGKS